MVVGDRSRTPRVLSRRHLIEGLVVLNTLRAEYRHAGGDGDRAANLACGKRHVCFAARSYDKHYRGCPRKADGHVGASRARIEDMDVVTDHPRRGAVEPHQVTRHRSGGWV